MLLKGVFMRVAQQAVTRHRWATTLMGLILMACTFLVHARSPQEVPALSTMLTTELPREGQETYQRIRKGGPFPYEKDGTVFGNRERILPREARGYYREYTVRTPGERNRGARRIVCGGPVPSEPKACYYTQDHYASFRMIVDKP
ncbi:ribonuclease domain-containing protein [Limnohabitans sp. 2KL-1]|jgi:ribonuclease T1|uniref:ribonuclease domain-containing protein n=1 Tax=Limnohabitans sp. 2KL-1 TaxID=1100699 RepID=UPI0035143BF9